MKIKMTYDIEIDVPNVKNHEWDKKFFESKQSMRAKRMELQYVFSIDELVFRNKADPKNILLSVNPKNVRVKLAGLEYEDENYEAH